MSPRKAKSGNEPADGSTAGSRRKSRQKEEVTPAKSKELVGDTDVPTNLAEGKWLDARYVGEAITDLTMVRPGQPFVQTWTLENRGTQRWPEGCMLVRMAAR